MPINFEKQQTESLKTRYFLGSKNPSRSITQARIWNNNLGLNQSFAIISHVGQYRESSSSSSRLHSSFLALAFRMSYIHPSRSIDASSNFEIRAVIYCLREHNLPVGFGVFPRSSSFCSPLECPLRYLSVVHTLSMAHCNFPGLAILETSGSTYL